MGKSINERRQYYKSNVSSSRRADIESIKQVRKLAGMPERKIEKRLCLKCGKKFSSDGIYNRICDSCKISNSVYAQFEPYQEQAY